MKFLLLQLLLASSVAVRAQSTCSPYRLVWVSCTTMGDRIDNVGQAVVKSLKAAKIDVDDEFVLYPATTPRDSSTQKGASQLATDMNAYKSQCPDQNFILGGYSQGVIVLHRASLEPDIINRIAAVIVFGDPVPGNSFYPVCEPSRAVATCGDNDYWCNNSTRGARHKDGGVQNLDTTGTHKDYESTADAAVKAIMNSINDKNITQCTLPPPPDIVFDNHLNLDS